MVLWGVDLEEMHQDWKKLELVEAPTQQHCQEGVELVAGKD